MIKLINVKKSFNKKSANPIVIFNDLNLEINTNCFNTILGRSGSGKSTLLNLIGGIDSPDSGNIYIDDVDITILKEKEMALYKNKTIGYIFQRFLLEPSLSVMDNVCMPLVIRGVEKKKREEKAIEILKYLKLDDRKEERITNLSGGECQRVCIARALISDAKIILADEPTGNLDYESGQEVLDYLKNISKEKTIILITHNREDAYKYSDYIYELKDGKILNTYKMGENHES